MARLLLVVSVPLYPSPIRNAPYIPCLKDKGFYGAEGIIRWTSSVQGCRGEAFLVYYHIYLQAFLAYDTHSLATSRSLLIDRRKV
jgi:hypothetical protein